LNKFICVLLPQQPIPAPHSRSSSDSAWWPWTLPFLTSAWSDSACSNSADARLRIRTGSRSSASPGSRCRSGRMR